MRTVHTTKLIVDNGPTNMSDEFANCCEQRGMEVVDNAAKAKERPNVRAHDRRCPD